MTERNDGGEAILEALRNLDVDYIISSPGSEWPPVWEALARQKISEADGPGYINCWHETLAVAMAMGYTNMTGRLQAVLLHAGVGLLQGSLGIQGANKGEVPMLICSGESTSFGDDSKFDPGSQWFRNLSVVGGPNRLVEPIVKWSSKVDRPETLYDTVRRAGEMAQRVPRGPIYLDIPIEVMVHEWTPPLKGGKFPVPPKPYPQPDAINKLAKLLAESQTPLIVTESCGRDVEAFRYLVQLAELLSIPVVEPDAPAYANFPKDHPLHLGHDLKPLMDQADLFLLIGSKAPWYPPSAGPATGTVVVIDENPLKAQMVHQTLHADMYVEGDIAATLRLLIEAVTSGDRANVNDVRDKKSRWEGEHNRLHEGYRSAVTAARDKKPVDPVWLCAALSEVMPEDAIYVDETIVHRPAILKHVEWSRPQSYFRATGGLGVGLGQALGVKLAAPERPVVSLIGDGSFLYNPIVQSFGASQENNLPILIVVFNNAKYASMQRTHLEWYPEGAAATSGIYHGVAIPGPNYAQLVEPFGGYGVRVEDPDHLRPALQDALAAVNSGRLALVDVVLGS